MNRNRVLTFVGVAALAAGIVIPLVAGGVLSSTSSATSLPPAPPVASGHPVTVSGLMPPIVSGALVPPRVAVPPTRVEIPGTGIAVDVQPVGIEADGFLQVPEDVAIAGWYKFGSDPGSPTGTTVIAAHVDSNIYGLGPFAELKNLGAGTVVVVTSSDGTQRNYVVQSVDKVAKTQLPLDSVFDRDGAPRLVLITCGGQFDYDSGHYDDNVVVTALPVTG